MNEKKLCVALCAIAAGCSEAGALGQAAFTGECAGSDVACIAAGLDGPIASGATIHLAIDTTAMGSGASPFELRALDPEVLAIEGTDARGVGAGMSALFVEQEGVVVDFIHLFVEEADTLALRRLGDFGSLGPLDSRVQLLVGDEMVVSADLARGSQDLLGRAETEWIVDNDVALSILDEGHSGLHRIVARSPGEAIVIARAVELEAQLEIEVLP